jgi:hypothetical protein
LLCAAARSHPSASAPLGARLRGTALPLVSPDRARQQKIKCPLVFEDVIDLVLTLRIESGILGFFGLESDPLTM